MRLIYLPLTLLSALSFSPAAQASSLGNLETRVAAAGDVACSSPGSSLGCLASDTASLIKNLNPHKVFALGDLVYDSGTYANFLSGYNPTWGQFKAKTYPVPGNHEYNDPGAAGYKKYWGTQALPSGKTWYSKTIGSWRIVVLDSNCASVGGCGPGAQQTQWLQNQLAHAPACTLAMWHHPRVSSGPHGNNDNMGTFWSMLAAAHVEFVLAGHDHDYERFHTLRSDTAPSDSPASTREFVVGTGGKTFYPFVAIKTGSEKRIVNTAGVLSLGLHQHGYQWRFRNTSGLTLDQGSSNCR